MKRRVSSPPSLRFLKAPTHRRRRREQMGVFLSVTFELLLYGA